MVGIVVILSGLMSIGGIASAVIALVQEGKQTTTTGRRNAIIGLVLSGVPLMCCASMILLGILGILTEGVS